MYLNVFNTLIVNMCIICVYMFHYIGEWCVLYCYSATIVSIAADYFYIIKSL